MKESDKSFSNKNTILTKSFKFSVRTIKAYKILVKRDSSLLPLFRAPLKTESDFFFICGNQRNQREIFSRKLRRCSQNRFLEIPFRQLLRSGASIGANISEAQSAFTKKDFINKLGISLKESRETEYWLRLLRECDLLSEKEFKSLHFDSVEIIKLLTSIIKSSKLNRKN